MRNAIIYVIGFFIVAGVVSAYIVDTPEKYLEERYASVSSLKLNYFQISCNRGKHRLAYDFTATRETGETVKGYVCFTKGDIGFNPPVIHEDQ